MKALCLENYGSVKALKLQEMDIPEPAENEVRVKVIASSANDWDWAIIQGSPFYIRLLSGLLRPKIKVLGVDVSGVIDAKGKNVNQFEIGDEFYADLSEVGFGAFAEYVCLKASTLTRKPTGLSLPDAAAIPHAGLLAYQALVGLANLNAEQSLLINGAGGGVGTLGVQIAKAIGVRDITGVDSDSKLEQLAALGFSKTINYKEEDFTKSTLSYDLILDAKTNRSPFAYLAALNPGGIYVTVGGSALRLIQILLFAPFIRFFTKKRLCILALKPNKDLMALNTLIEAGQLLPHIDSYYPLENAAEGMQHFGEAKHCGKVIFTLTNSEAN